MLLRFGVERARLATFLDSRAQRWLPADLVATLPAVLAEAPDPLLALTNLERLAECEALARGVDRPAEWWRHLVTLLGGSQSLANWLVSQGADWPQAFSAALGGQPTSAAGHLERLQDLVALDWSRFADALRQYRHREYLRIGLHDLIGAYTVDATWSELSELAAGAVECAYRWARQQVTTSYGELNHAGGTRAGFVVLGMGKLGGGELNFSSDIDLVYLYESDEGQSSGGPGGALPPRAYFTRVAELLTRALQEVTERGFAFRVDLRLRPDGINGPIVNSVSNALLYYESYGQTWERTALLKARPIAGTLELGERFLQEVRPFVFRRYLDYGTLEDMQRMKAQIEGHLARKSNEWNVKLGRGGIREIEFIVQTMQLVHGGRDERVRCRPTLEALDRLARYRYLPEPDAASLAEAYRFLRNVEHKIQLVAQRQTHAVPREEREQETLARRVGYRGEQARQQFWVDLSRHTSAVRGAFEKLFFQPAAERRAQVDDTEQKILAALGDPEAALALLASLGFHDPAQCYEHLLLLRDGPAHAPSSPRRRQVLFEILPAMLAAMRQAPHPDLALQNMASFVSAVGARTSFLMLLRENPGTMRMLVQLFATSQYLANQFIRHPELLDSLVRADLVRIRKAKDELAAELASALDAAEDFEGKLDALRRFRNQEFLRIGINCVQDLLADEEVAEELTQLAEACLQAAVDLAVQQTLKRFELPRAAQRLAHAALPDSHPNRFGRVHHRPQHARALWEQRMRFQPGAEFVEALVVGQAVCEDYRVRCARVNRVKVQRLVGDCEGVIFHHLALHQHRNLAGMEARGRERGGDGVYSPLAQVQAHGHFLPPIGFNHKLGGVGIPMLIGEPRHTAQSVATEVFRAVGVKHAHHHALGRFALNNQQAVGANPKRAMAQNLRQPLRTPLPRLGDLLPFQQHEVVAHALHFGEGQPCRAHFALSASLTRFSSSA